MSNSIDFVDRLLEELQTIRDRDSHRITQDSSEPFPDFVIRHWLNFAVYYERAAVSFIGGWLSGVQEEDALHHYTHQIEDECQSSSL